MYLRIEGYPPAELLSKHNLPEEALFFQPPSVKRSRQTKCLRDRTRSTKMKFFCTTGIVSSGDASRGRVVRRVPVRNL